MSRRPYTMHSYSKMKIPDKEEVKNVGIYTTNESRKEVAKEIKRTHFQLGSDLSSFPHSLNQDTYQNMQVDDRNLGDQQKRMAKINKRSNFVFGNDPSGKGETTSNQTYNSKQFSHLSGNSNTFSANTLRKGNFRLGFNNESTYETTSNANFNDKNPEFTRSHVNVNRGDKNTIPLGNGKTSYQTTNNLNFTQKDVAESFKDKLLMRQRGEKLKKANFSFGHFNNRNSLKNEPHNITDHANKFHSEMVKQKQQAKQRGVELKKSNFQLSKDPKYGSDSNAFKSMAQFQFNEEQITGDNMAQENKKNSEISKNLQTNLRSSHFEFGNNKGNQGSCSHDAHQKFNIDQKGLDDSNKLAKKMQSSNFELGSNKYKGLPLQSTYKDSANLNVDYGKVKADSSNIDSKKTTIDIGKGKCYDYTSEAKSKFVMPQGKSSTIDHSHNNMSYLKKNHFNLGNDRNDYSTVNKTDFDSKPNPGFKKHQGNNQQTTFKMGFQNSQFSATKSANTRLPYTDRNKHAPYQRVVGEAMKSSNSSKQANAMQRENFSLGKNGGEFKTINQGYYKWIQPKGDR